MPALQKKHKKSSVHNIKSVMNTRYGPSDRIRTCGILLPKQARYQLRYTRLLSCFIRLGAFSQSKRATNCATPRFYSNLALLEWMGSPNSIMDFLPKVNGDRCISRKKDL